MKIDQTASCCGQRVVVWLCLAALLGLGLAIYRDYGISSDEGISRVNGHVSLAYILTMLPKGWQEALMSSATLNRLRLMPPLHEYVDRDYGVVFELPAALGESVFGIQDGRDVYLYRHLLTFLVCSGGVVAVYQLVARRFRDWHVGLLGALMLVLSPRLFADSFYNSKDAVFLAFFAIGLNTLVRFLLHPTRRRAAVHASTSQIAELERILGQHEEKTRRGEFAIEEDSQFHYNIALASGNSVVLKVVDVLMELLKETRERSLQVEGRPQRSLGGHKRILAALKRGDGPAAEAAMRRHIEEVENIVLKRL